MFTNKKAPAKTNKVFIVHGKDSLATEKIARFIYRLKLEPIILQEQPNRSRTLMEKLESHSQVSYAVILFTPDDEGKMVSEVTPLKPRARQNVIFELGYFVGLLGRDKVCALYSEGVDLPSDLDGVSWIPFNNSESWRLLLAREIKAAGLYIDLNNAL